MIDFTNREYVDVVIAVCGLLSAAASRYYRSDDYIKLCEDQIAKLKAKEIDFIQVFSLLDSYARYEMESGFLDYAENILHLICLLHFHQDSPMMQRAESSYRLSE
jgi:hypothetical protein